MDDAQISSGDIGVLLGEDRPRGLSRWGGWGTRFTTAFDRKERWFLAIAGAISILSAFGAFFFVTGAKPPYNSVAYIFATDFANTWIGALVSLTGDPSPWFDFTRFNDELKAHFGPEFPPHIWSYPPHLLLLTWPLGFLSIVPAYLVWMAFTFLAFVLAIRGEVKHPLQLLLILTAPAVSANIYVGQIGFLVSALMIGGLLTMDRRPIFAGILFGLLTIKPQLGVLLPVMLVVTQRWRTIAAAVLTAATLFVLTLVVFGLNVWSEYFRVAGPPQTKIIMEGYKFFMHMMPTPFMNLRAAGVAANDALIVQGLVSFVVCCFMVWVYRRRTDRDLQNAALVSLTFLATLYAFHYDIIMFGWVFVLLMRRDDNTPLDYFLMLLVWATPLMLYFTGVAHIACTSIPVALFCLRLMWRIWKAEPEKQEMPEGGRATAVAA